LLQFLRGSSPTGLKNIVVSMAVALLSLPPPLLYILLGPADGIPSDSDCWPLPAC